MSVVLNHSKASGVDKLVLLGIANHAGDGGAFPSLETLARYANASERTVRRSLRHLEELGELRTYPQQGGCYAETCSKEHQHTRNDQRPNRYEVLVVDNPSDGGTRVSARESERGDNHGQNGGTRVSAEPSLEPSISQPPSDEGVTSAPAIQEEDVENRDVRRHPHWPNVLNAVTALARDNDLDRNELLALIAEHAPTDPWTGYLAIKHQVYVIGLGDARDATKVLSHRLAGMKLARLVDAAAKCSEHQQEEPCSGCAADRKAVSANLPRSNPGGVQNHSGLPVSAARAGSGPFPTPPVGVSATGGGQ